VNQSHDEIQSETRGRDRSILATVRTALRDNRLFFAFQPVVCAATGEVDYFECLLRMREPEGAIVPGGSFITTIEKLGLIGFIDGYALEQTVQELANYPKIRLGLNNRA
jgi:EAL domain-containing protein (putative c-di-GMP-specific phosphodiesterase class I)